MNAGEIDQYSEQGKLLQQVVMMKLREFLGPAYNDEVLPLYIVVMLAHGNPEKLVTENLEAFLGAEQAGVFATWLFEHLQANKQSYVRRPAAAQEKASSQPAAAAQATAAPAAAAAAPAETRKPSGKMAASGQPMPAANGAVPAPSTAAEPAAAAAAPAASAPTGRRRSSGDAPHHLASPSRQQDDGYRDRKRSRSREGPHRQTSGRRYEDRGDRHEDVREHCRHDRASGHREPGHRGGRYEDGGAFERHRQADDGRGVENGARGGPARYSGRGRDDHRSERDHQRYSGDEYRDERRPRDQRRDDRLEPRDRHPDFRREQRPHAARSVSPGDREKRRRDSGRSAERGSDKLMRVDRSGSPAMAKREWDKDKAINPQTSRPWGEEDAGEELAPAAASPPGHRSHRSSMLAAEGARSEPAERPASRAKVDGTSRSVFASALRQATPAAEASVPRDALGKASRPRPSVFSRLEPGSAQPSRRSGTVLNPPIPGARRIPTRDHDPHGPPALLDDGPELAGDLNDYSPFSHPAPRPSRPQVRPAQPVRQELIDDDDLGDVLTEESEGLPQTRSLSPRKRHLPSDQGTPEELEAMRKRLRSMELAVSQLQKAPSGPGAAAPASLPSNPPHQRSISIQNVHPAATPAVLIAHFSGCGPIKRATVVKNQATGQPLGLAHVEFETQAAALGALSLSGSLLLQQSIIVMPKAAKKGPVKGAPVPQYAPRPFRHSYPPSRPFSPRPAFIRGRGRSLTLNNSGRGRANGVQRPRSLKYVRPQSQQPPAASSAEVPDPKPAASVTNKVDIAQSPVAIGEDEARVDAAANGHATPEKA